MSESFFKNRWSTPLCNSVTGISACLIRNIRTSMQRCCLVGRWRYPPLRVGVLRRFLPNFTGRIFHFLKALLHCKISFIQLIHIYMALKVVGLATKFLTNFNLNESHMWKEMVVRKGWLGMDDSLWKMMEICIPTAMLWGL